MLKDKYLLFSDLHLNTWKSFGLDTATGMSRRLKEQLSVLDQIIQLCKDHQVTRVLFLADLFHPVGTVPVECLNIAYQFFWRLHSINVQYNICSGNHDLIDRVNPKWFQDAGWIFKKDSNIFNDKVRLISYNEPVNYEELVGFDILVLHKTPIGARVGQHEFSEGVYWRRLIEKNKSVWFGHIHQRQELAPNCIVVGSPMHLTFGDEGDRGVYIYDGGIPQFIKLDYPEFKTINEEGKDDIDWLAIKVDTKNYYRILGVNKRVEMDNVISSIVPEFFEERIKAQSFSEILLQWMSLKGVDQTYLESIKDLITEKVISFQTIFKGKLKFVHVKNFKSVGEASYELTNGFVLIEGNSLGEFNSNGSGKSSLFGEAIYWCLFGSTTTGLTGKDVIRRGEKDCQVSITLVNDTESSCAYKITRSRVTGLEVIRYNLSEDENPVDLFEGMREVDKQTALEQQILGFDRDVFLSSCYFSQEALKMLTAMGDADRTAMITRLLGFEIYDELYESIFDRIKGLNINLDELQQVEKLLLMDIQGVLCRVKDQEQNLNICNEQIKRIKDTIYELEIGLKNYNEQILLLPSTTAQDFSEIDADLKSMKDAEESLTQSLKKYRKRLEDCQTEKNKIIKDATGYEFDIKYAEQEIDRVRALISSAEKLEIGAICDKCGAKIEKSNVSSFVEDYYEQIGRIEEKIKKVILLLESTHLASEKNGKTLQDIRTMEEELNRKVLEVKQHQVALCEEKEKEKEKLQEVSIKKTQLLERISAYQVSLRYHKLSLDNTLEQLNEYRKRKDAIDEELEQKNLELGELPKKTTKINEEIKMLDFWKFAFSSKGIRALLLDGFCNEFNQIVNPYLASVSNGLMNIVIRPTMQLKSGDERNKIGMDIYIGSDVVGYESLSGGEKRRVDFAVCLSLNTWIAKRNDIANGLLGMVIFDELFAFLDKAGEESIGNVLYEEGMTKAVLVISHFKDLESYCNSIWKVRKENGISYLDTGEVNEKSNTEKEVCNINNF